MKCCFSDAAKQTLSKKFGLMFNEAKDFADPFYVAPNGKLRMMFTSITIESNKVSYFYKGKLVCSMEMAEAISDAVSLSGFDASMEVTVEK